MNKSINLIFFNVDYFPRNFLKKSDFKFSKHCLIIHKKYWKLLYNFSRNWFLSKIGIFFIDFLKKNIDLKYQTYYKKSHAKKKKKGNKNEES